MYFKRCICADNKIENLQKYYYEKDYVVVLALNESKRLFYKLITSFMIFFISTLILLES